MCVKNFKIKIEKLKKNIDFWMSMIWRIGMIGISLIWGKCVNTNL